MIPLIWQTVPVPCLIMTCIGMDGFQKNFKGMPNLYFIDFTMHLEQRNQLKTFQRNRKDAVRMHFCNNTKMILEARENFPMTTCPLGTQNSGRIRYVILHIQGQRSYRKTNASNFFTHHYIRTILGAYMWYMPNNNHTCICFVIFFILTIQHVNFDLIWFRWLRMTSLAKVVFLEYFQFKYI